MVITKFAYFYKNDLFENNYAVYSAVGTGDAGDAGASSSKFFFWQR